MAQDMNAMHVPLSRNDQQEALTGRQQLIDILKQSGCLSTPAVEAAFRAVPRHLFLPGIPFDKVYVDEAIPTKYQDGFAISSSSQPAVMATILEQLEVQAGHHIVEIGAGTGYNAALLATLAGEEGQVVTIDIDDDIVTDAQEHLKMAGFHHVRVVCGDGAFGYRDAAPYDRIILTVGSWDIAPAWIDQLKPGGRLLLPLALRANMQQLVAFERVDTHLVSISVRAGGFMQLRGAGAGPQTQIPLGPTPGLVLGLEEPRAIDARQIYAHLIGPHTDRAISLRVTPQDIWGGINHWLALHAPTTCHLTAMGALAQQNVVPDLFGVTSTYQATLGLLGGTTLCVLVRSASRSANRESPGDIGACMEVDAPARTLRVRRFGPDEQLAERLIEHLSAWERAGRPSTMGLRIRAYPQEVPYTPSVSEIIIAKRWTRLVLDWPS
jgi:protein-L-isoaspartate(D-aspartate) O-methyltransferase